jgi:hypothetical protein
MVTSWLNLLILNDLNVLIDLNVNVLIFKLILNDQMGLCVL